MEDSGIDTNDNEVTQWFLDTTTGYSIIVRVQKGFCMAVKFYVKRISLKANRFVF